MVKNSYPLPVIEDQLNRLSGNKYFISLDMFAGYHQIPVSSESIPYTAFITQDGLYEYLRMPFGLATAPSIFQRAINGVLGQLRFSKVLCYLDDILIPAKTVDQALGTLLEILEVLKNNGFTVKLQKCYFLKTEIEYLGYIVSELGISPSDHKIEAVNHFPIPQNIH